MVVLVETGCGREKVVNEVLAGGLEFDLHLGDVDDGTQTLFAHLLASDKLFAVRLK